MNMLHRLMLTEYIDGSLDETVSVWKDHTDISFTPGRCKCIQDTLRAACDPGGQNTCEGG